jgi:PAS domain S-box-containing protein
LISAQSYTLNAYTEADIRLLEGIANQVSIAIENSRLYASAQQEIKERLRAEMELQRERDFAVQVMNTLGQGVAVSMLDGIYEYVNPAYAAMLGYKPEEMVGELSDDFVHPEDLEQLNRETSSRYQGEATTYEIRLLHKDGHIVHALVTGVPRYANGKIIGAIAAVTDLTERKRTEIERENMLKEMERKNAELERFTYTVSHDLKSPLVTIAGFLGFLELDIERGNYGKVSRTVMRIHEAAKRMQRLLDELLELSRIGRIVNPPVEVPFGELVRETLELVDGQLREKQVRVQVEAELPIVRVDRVRMIEVIQNLVTNAIKFMGGQTSPLIEIGSCVEDGKTVFFVKDNGMGIEPQFHDRVFGLFNKLDAQTEGTGIGLALVKRIIEVHGGKIWVQSEPGKGATFFFTLG